MNLETLKVTNFRRFEHLEVSFHPELTILAARNGQGKTSILDAAAIALGTFVGAFDLGTAKHIAQADARYQRLPGHSDSEQVFPVRLEATLKSMDKPVIRELLGAKGRTTIKHASALTGLGKILMKQVQALESVPLPLLAYYGSGRLWNAHKNMSRKSVLSESRTLGYEDCFSSASSFTQVQQWMTKATFAALQQQSMEVYQGHKIADQIKGIQNTVDTVLSSDGWSGFHYSVQHEELAMTHEELGVLPVSMLSDGVRAMVSLVADMAWRCAKLNPQMGADASKKTAGIAFIDEVDMHLHPKWQQTVIGSLRSAFPNVQFIVTTHSPQVLSTVKSESIRLVRSELDRETGKFISQAVIPTMQSRGVASNDVMAELQGTDAVPNVEEAKWLQDYKALVTSNQLTPEQANRKQALMTNIIAHFGDDHPEWLECQRIERLQAMKAKLAGKLSAGKSRD
ncbi:MULTISPECIES: AAA family ATPase [unclassified Marinobacter]|uniref:AAA family ATPase n=1 Tax=unclassified Marinobacter TaxID=83889 RepID=UPI000BF5F121|nr:MULTISPECIES: AAA family ATPase [unclassified Marinobacter]PFG08821.1 putative ATP-binding protein involved in virulence [Marinobacter sp. LV10MA510-1]PFG54687.1 putative ATP-binding protein involved in virulence [Marinobacter sp. LV10R520-4]